MPWLVDFLTALFYSCGNGGETLLLLFFLFGFLVLVITLWGRSTAKNKSPEDYLHGRLRDGYLHHWHNWGSEGLSDHEAKIQKRLLDGGLDWILEHCIIHSPGGPKLSHIKRVAAAWAGYIRDVRGPDTYRWIVELQNGRFMYLYGFFDPSGFELRTYLFTRIADSAEKAALYEIHPKTLRRMNKDHDVYAALLDQIKSGKRDWAGFKWASQYAP